MIAPTTFDFQLARGVATITLDAELGDVAGVALVAGETGAPFSARLSYRRMWSDTADRQPGEPDSGVNQELVALTATAAWRSRVYLSGGLRYNLLFAEFDDEQLSLRVRLTPRQWVTLEHDYLAPTFDGDSIWNIFSTGAYRDLRASYEIGLPRGVKAYARGFARFYLATTDEIATTGPYAGQDVGAMAPPHLLAARPGGFVLRALAAGNAGVFLQFVNAIDRRHVR